MSPMIGGRRRGRGDEEEETEEGLDGGAGGAIPKTLEAKQM